MFFYSIILDKNQQFYQLVLPPACILFFVRQCHTFLKNKS